MKLLKKILGRLNGLHYPQEYLCLAKESFQKPLHAYLVENEKPIQNITNHHLFVGYCPLVFALPSTTFNGKKADSIDIAFIHETASITDNLRRDKVLALISLKKIAQQTVGEERVFYYEGINGWHRFISNFHQYNIRLYNKLYNQKTGNVFLEDNLYKQVQIAYSLPRKISLISIGNQGLYNHFPTDLHGQINEQFYIISLRHGGNACQQVQVAEKIVLSDMQASAYKQAYALGKNHMQPLKEQSHFDFSDEVSRHFHLPLPKNLVGYKELELQESFVHGIHRFLLFKIIYSEQVTNQPQTLTHIHNVYATWRHKMGMESNYLLR